MGAFKEFLKMLMCFCIKANFFIIHKSLLPARTCSSPLPTHMVYHLPWFTCCSPRQLLTTQNWKDDVFFPFFSKVSLKPWKGLYTRGEEWWRHILDSVCMMHEWKHVLFFADPIVQTLACMRAHSPHRNKRMRPTLKPVSVEVSCIEVSWKLNTMSQQEEMRIRRSVMGLESVITMTIRWYSSQSFQFWQLWDDTLSTETDLITTSEGLNQ
jgi:hypothetical protein